MRSRRILLVGALALLLGPATALTQMGQGPGGGGGRGASPGGGGRGAFPGGGGMMNQDPSERWNQMTGGKDVWVRSQITDQRQQFSFDFISRQLNITNGQITRQQYLDFSEQMRQRFQQGGGFGGRGGAGRGPGGQPGTPGVPPGGPGAGPGGPGGPPTPEAMAEILFRRYDKNGDGVLNNDEMSETLRAERDKWDTNKDGLIDLNEFKEFVKARFDQIRSEVGWPAPGAPGSTESGTLPMLPTGPAKEEEEPKKVVVYRTGKMPKELPAWFSQIDKDGDGQIGLYEWKNGWQASGRSFDDFFKMDRNGDGFLTVEEVLRFEADQKKGPGGNGTMTAANAPGSAAGGQPGAFNGGPGRFNGNGPAAGAPANPNGGPPGRGMGGPRNGGGNGRNGRANRGGG